jgi:hypothetical protein
MARKPKTSTLNNFTSAWNRLIATAVERGYISERVPVPKLTAKGVKGTARPAFSEEEIAQLFAFMEEWTQFSQGSRSKTLTWNGPTGRFATNGYPSIIGTALKRFST